jgi:hypothetical protein
MTITVEDMELTPLFTVENFMYSRGAYDGLLWANRGYGSSIVSYHIAIDWLKTLRSDTHLQSTITNTTDTQINLEVQPAPPSGNALEVTDENGQIVTYDSPGYLLVRSYMMEGSHYANMESDNSLASWKRTGLRQGSSDTNYYTSDWIFDYAMAECKIMLGRIRSKFAQFTSIGNIGIALDGDPTNTGRYTRKRTDLEETIEIRRIP